MSNLLSSINYLICSPLDSFETLGLIILTIPVIGDFVISLTNIGLYTILATLLILNLQYIANNQNRLIPSNWSLSIEIFFATLKSIVVSQIGKSSEEFLPFIYSIFIFVLFLNLNGNIPYGYTVTSSIIVSLGLSVTIFLGVTILIFYQHGFHSLSYFVPAGTPLALVPILVLIELISYLARAISLGVRLFANIVSGHSLLAILSTFLGQIFLTSFIVGVLTLLPFSIFVFLVVLEIVVSFIQAYVFSILVCSYIKDAKYLH